MYLRMIFGIRRVALFGAALCMLAAQGGWVLAQDTPENADLKLAVNLYNDGLYESAEEQFRRFIEKFPNAASSVEARYYLGMVQMKLKKYSDARATFQDFAVRHTDNPRAPEAWMHVGEAYVALRNYPEAANAYARVKTFHPKHTIAPQALLEAGRNFIKAGDLDNARMVLNSILLEYPKSPAVLDATFTLGKLLVDAGEYDRAYREYSRVLTAGDAGPELKARATVAVGEVLNLQGNKLEAETRFREVIKSYAKTTAVHEASVRLGDLLRQNGNCVEAKAEYDLVIKNNAAPPEYRREAYIGAAECAVAAGDFAAAKRMYDSLFQVNKDQPVEPDVYRKAAFAARKHGDYTTAGRYLESILRDTIAGSDKREVLVELARNAAEGHNFNAAIQYYQTYLNRYPNDDGSAFAQYEIARIYDKEFGNTTRASELFGSVIERYGAGRVADKAQFARASALETASRFREAREAYAQLLTQFPGSGLSDEAARRVRFIDRYRQTASESSLARIAAMLSSLNSTAASGSMNLLLGELYLLDLKDNKRAYEHFTLAEKKQLTVEESERAKFGKAMAASRLAQSGESGRGEAEQLLNTFIREYPSSPLQGQALIELFQLQTEGMPPAAVLDVAARLLPGVKPGPAAVEIRMRYAEALFQNSRLAEAEKEFTAILTESGSDPASREALYGRGLTRAARTMYPQAVDDFKQYLMLNPNGSRAAHSMLELGRVSVKIGRHDEAVRHFETLVERYPYSPFADSARIQELYAILDMGMGERARVKAETFHVEVERHPFLSDDLKQEYLYHRAVVSARTHDLPGAKSALQSYVARYPSGKHIGDVYFALGQIFRDEGKLSLASLYLQQAGSLSQNVQAGREAADLMLENKRYADAIKEYEVMAQKSTSVMERSYATSRIVLALYRSGNATQAQAKAAEFRAAYPEAVDVSQEFELERGKHLFKLKQYEQAKDAFEDIEDSNNKEIASHALHWLGRIYEEQSKNDKAGEYFRETIKKYPGTIGALESRFALARIAMRAEKYDVAALEYKAAVDQASLPPDMLKEAMNGLIKCYDEMRFYTEAAEMTKRFIAAYPYDPTTFRKKVNLGHFYYELKYFDQAAQYFQSLLAEAPPEDHAEIRYYIGESIYYKGEFEKAALEFLKVPYLVIQKGEIDWTSSAYYMAGQSYERLSKFALAIQMYEKIISTPGILERDKAQAEKERDRVKALMR